MVGNGRLFKFGEFTSASGKRLAWKVDCDGLPDDDLKAIAALYGPPLNFRAAVGIPRGGLRLAEALQEYATGLPGDPLLIVDDVFTSGHSITEYVRLHWPEPSLMPRIAVFVIFDRSAHAFKELYVYDGKAVPVTSFWRLGTPAEDIR